LRRFFSALESMAFAKRRPFKRSSYRKRRSFKRPSYRKRRAPFRRYRNAWSGLPVHKTVSLRYCDNVDLASASSALHVYSFRANSIYDPDLTGIGHQPMGRDLWSAQYNHYIVLGSRIRIYAECLDDVNVDHYTLGVVLHEDGMAISGNDSRALQENGKSRFHYLMSGPDKSRSSCTLVQTFSAKRFFGMKDVRDNRDTVGAAVGNNPSDGAYFMVYIEGNALSSLGCRLHVTIDYIVDFTEPVEQLLN